MSREQIAVDREKNVLMFSDEPLKGHFTLITFRPPLVENPKSFTRFAFFVALSHSDVMGIDVIPSLYISSPLNG